jgi:hypothetical protein
VGSRFVYAVRFHEAPDGASPSAIWPMLILFYILYAGSLRHRVEIKAGIHSYATVEVLSMVFYYVLFFWPHQIVILDQLNKSKFVATTFIDGRNRATILASLALVFFRPGIAARRQNCSMFLSPKLDGARATGIVTDSRLFCSYPKSIDLPVRSLCGTAYHSVHRLLFMRERPSLSRKDN